MSKKQVGKYMLDRRIGKGSYAQVWLGHCDDSNETVAVKVISRHTVSETSQLRQEVAVLKKIDHVNIVKFKDLKKSVGHYYLVLEYCEGGDLARFIQKRHHIREDPAQRFLRQLSAGLLVLHRLNFIHRDLKPQNILLSEESEDAILKIADFGFARALNPADMAATVCGSPLYMAPEILRHERYDGKADLWSIGSIFFELLFGHPPFSGPNPMQLLATIESSPKRIVFPNDIQISDNCQSLLSAVLVRDPLERLSPETFFSHDYNLGPDGGEQAGRVLEDLKKLEEEAEMDDITMVEEGSPSNLQDRASSSDDQMVRISFELDSEEKSPPDCQRAAGEDLVVLLRGTARVLSEALAVRRAGALADSYAATLCALGILLRHIASEMVKPDADEDRVVDALGVAVKGCALLDSALDEIADKPSRAVLELELKTSLEMASNIKSRLSYRGYTESAKPLRWVYSFLMDLLLTTEPERETSSENTLDGCLLLIDFLLNEFDALSEENLSKDEEDAKHRQERGLRELREKLVSSFIS